MPLSRVSIYSTMYDFMSLNLFVYSKDAKQLATVNVPITGKIVCV